jgi:hypothetical protein
MYHLIQESEKLKKDITLLEKTNKQRSKRLQDVNVKKKSDETEAEIKKLKDAREQLQKDYNTLAER